MVSLTIIYKYILHVIGNETVVMKNINKSLFIKLLKLRNINK
jgi:hypothetical protein